MKNEDTCPCKSGKTFGECCGPIISGEKKAETPEALMRARYSSYVTGDVLFLKSSATEEVQAEFDENASKAWSAAAEWHGLEIISTEKGGPKDDEGIVEFRALYTANGEFCNHHEVSKFVRQGGEWKFADGEPRVRSTRSAAAGTSELKPAAFLFDLDGTLVDTEDLWTKAIVDFVVSRGGRTTYEEILPTVIGRNWLDIDRSLHERFPEIGESSAMEDAVELRRFYDVYATNPSSMRIDGSIAFFHAVSKIAPCAIVSGSPHDDVVAAAKLCGIDDRLSLVLGAGEYDAGKPSPSGFLKAAELLKVAPADCVVVEDSTVGVKAGVAAGMKVIALDRAALVPQTYGGETWRVKDLSEIDVGKEFS